MRVNRKDLKCYGVERICRYETNPKQEPDDSDLGFRISFGFRPSGFGLQMASASKRAWVAEVSFVEDNIFLGQVGSVDEGAGVSQIEIDV